MWHIVVQIACSKYDEHIEIAVLYQIEHVFFVYHALLYARFEVVVYELASHSGDRLFACWIDITEYHFVEVAECLGKILIEISCTGVEMRLKDSRELTVLVKFAQALATLEDLFWVVCLVG